MLKNLDLAVLYFFNHKLANPVFDWFFLFIAESKIFLAALVILAIILFWRGSNRLRIAMILVVACVAIVDPLSHYILKPLIGRIRPCYELDNIRLLVGCGGRFSFPSNHAANSFAIACLIAYFYKRYAAPVMAFAVLVGISRIYLGRHYPSDVLGGMLLGAMIACLIIYLFRSILHYLESKNIISNRVKAIQGVMPWRK
jgi:undecaprenyl-diphosphatase